ncbi:MAG: protein-disulfide reductase DsbD [Candidatus Riflebacteria bacterium]|nr:protein-disulfide reductase DsbD [Candidatus Riflebacteria bacterium]
MKTRFFIILTLIVFCFRLNDVQALQKGFDFSLSEPAVVTDKQIASQSNVFAATLSINISDGYLIYRESSSVSTKNLKLLDQKWPVQVYKKDVFTGEQVSVLPSGKNDIYLEFLTEAVYGANSSEAMSKASFTSVTFSYQGCSTQTCFLPDEKEFHLRIPVQKNILPVSNEYPDSYNQTAHQKSVSLTASLTATITSSTTGSNTASITSPAAVTFSSVNNSAADLSSKSLSTSSLENNSEYTSTSKSASESTSESGSYQTPAGKTDFSTIIKQEGLLKAVLMAFFAGLLVSLTPCVYPMIPITLSIIGGRRENTSVFRGAILSTTYVAGLSITYALLGLITAKFGAHIRGFLQGPVFQLFIALIFALLSLSMFDVFMLQTPAFLRDKLPIGKKQGFTGIFFLGMLSGLLASPCVAAPLAGILAYIASTGSLLLGFSLLLAFSWGMGVLLIVVGTFSGTMNSLPKAGAWMEKVKEFYGFLMAGTAIYFAHPVIGTAFTNLATAALLAALAAFFGLFRNDNDNTSPEASESMFPRVMKCWGAVILVVACAFALNSAAEWGGLGCIRSSPEKNFSETATPIKWEHDYKSAVETARIRNIPVLIDFRADWCSICRDIEKNVFPDPMISQFSDKFVFLKIDLSENSPEKKEISNKFEVIGLPTLIFLKPSEEEIHNLRITGGISAKELAESLSNALNVQNSK